MAETPSKALPPGMQAVAAEFSAWATQEPWLVACSAMMGTGVVCLLLGVSNSQPLLFLLCAACMCLFVRFADVVERHGLVQFLPKSTHWLMEASPFQILGCIVNSVAIVGCHLTRLMMLLCMELNEAQKQELLTHMHPRFRQAIFRQPAVRLLPRSVRHVLMGRDSEKVVTVAETKATTAQPPSGGGQDASPTASREAKATSPKRERASSPDAAEGQRPPAPIVRCSTADSLLDLVQGMESVAHTAEAAAQVSALEVFLQRKVMSSTVMAAKSLASSANAQVWDTVGSGCSKVTELGQGVREAAARPRTQIAAASAVGGAAALGTGGAAAGLASGGLIGAAVGLVPAVFTFGLSIPIGAALGGGIGFATGATVGGTAGLFGAGALGYYAYGGERRAIDDCAAAPPPQ